MISAMNIDTFSTAALADELRLAVMGGRIQNIVQISPLAYGLEIYSQHQRRYLYLSANPQAARLHLQSQKPRRGTDAETPLFQLFRKYLKNGFLMSVEQPNLERVIVLHCSGKAGETSLVMEMLGTRSNLIFTDAEGRILHLARPVPAQPNRSRVLLPGHPYHLPQPQNKLTAPPLTVEVLQDVVARAPEETLLSRTLVTRLAGLSPLIAREIVYRAYLDETLTVSQAPDLSLLLAAIQDVFGVLSTRDWQPHVAFDKNERVKYFAPIALTHLPHAEAVDSISAAIEAHFSHLLDRGDDAYHAARFPIQLALEQAQKRVARRLKELAKDEARLEDPEVYQHKGEAILTYSYQISPGQRALEAPWTDDVLLTISLDPTLSPSENAQRYFARYQKAKRAATIIPKQRRTAKLEQEFLEQLTLDLQMAETRPEIDAVAAALQKAGFGKDFKQTFKKVVKKKAIPAAAQPRRFLSPDGFVIWVGRNAQQNHDLTFGRANPNDIWLHARGVPGSHVIISAPDGPPPKSTIAWAAGLAAYYSKAKKAGRAIVSYTRKKHVRPIKGAPPGLVRIRNESTVRVAPLNPDRPDNKKG